MNFYFLTQDLDVVWIPYLLNTSTLCSISWAPQVCYHPLSSKVSLLISQFESQQFSILIAVYEQPLWVSYYHSFEASMVLTQGFQPAVFYVVADHHLMVAMVSMVTWSSHMISWFHIL